MANESESKAPATDRSESNSPAQTTERPVRQPTTVPERPSPVPLNIPRPDEVRRIDGHYEEPKEPPVWTGQRNRPPEE
jgi:hypothetical protein